MKPVYLWEFLFEFILLSSYPLKALFFFLIPFVKKTKNNSGEKIPIIIVEQWFSQNIYHYFMKRYLEKHGFHVLMFNHSLFDKGIEEGAQSLKSFLEKNQIEKCILVGVSIGGLTAFTYVQKLGGWERVEKLICLGTPFGGTPWVGSFFYLKAGRELLPNSQFLKNLFSEKVKNPEKITCVNARYDELVPDDSSRLSGAKLVELDLMGHNMLHIVSKKTYETIASEASSI